MCFIYNENSLQVCCVCWQINLFSIFFKTLNINNRYFRFARIPLLCLIGTELFHKFRAGICCFNNQSTSFKLIRCLFQQIQSVNNKIELCHLIVLAKIICENICEIVRQGCFSTSLCMPNYTGSYTLIYFLSDNQSCKHLLITHYMFLVCNLNLSVNFFLETDISNTVLQNKQ